MIGRQPFGHAFTFLGNLLLFVPGFARRVTAVDIRLHGGRIHHVLEGQFGTTHGNVHRPKVKDISQYTDALIFRAQNVLQLGGRPLLTTKGLAVQVDDLFRIDDELVIAPVQDEIDKPSYKYQQDDEYSTCPDVYRNTAVERNEGLPRR